MFTSTRVVSRRAYTLSAMCRAVRSQRFPVYDRNGSNPLIVGEIEGRIAERGKIGFDEFMEVALYLPGGGYYTSDRDRWGRGGDYVTNLDAGPLFGRMVAVQLYEMWQVLAAPHPFSLVEVGAGRGTLSMGILTVLKELYPDMYSAVDVAVVEKNPYHRKGSVGKISWYEDIGAVRPEIVGCVLSNELIDALPVHLLVQQDGLKEIFIGIEGSDFVEIVDEPSTHVLVQYLDRVGVTLEEGQRVEINLKALDWIRRVGDMIKEGFIMTIDYGYGAAEYFGNRRRGTLLCHHRHAVNENPYVRVGNQDITSHVDFTGLALAGAEAGLEVTGFTTQFHFLWSLGILEELKEVSAFDDNGINSLLKNQEVKRLIMPGGMGETFKILVQHKGVEVVGLKGFNMRDFKEAL